MGYMLETRGLTKRFGRGDQAQDAVADVGLHIREGEVYGLLGPNGAGKSTTLKMICGMLRPTAGEILFAGHAWRREDLYAIGSLIEEAPLYPNLTARENLRVRTTLLGLPESRIDEVLDAATGPAVAGAPEAPLDRTTLARAAANLVVNAAEHARSRVAISCDVAGGHLVIEVADDGPGFSPAALERGCERLFTDDSSRSSRDGGRHYGLGLHAASEAASAHGGSVSLANSPSGGAVATIAVPLCGA